MKRENGFGQLGRQNKTMDTYELKRKASDFVKKEKFDKAIRIYERLLAKSPNDTSLLLKLGHIYQTIGQERNAIKIYSKVSDYFYNREMYHQGIAVCRLILGANPLDILAQKRLVDMYIKLYGGLPKRRGDTIIPPAYTERYSSIPPDIAGLENEQLSPSTPAATSSRDSWQPVDIVFSDSDMEPAKPYPLDNSPSEVPQNSMYDKNEPFERITSFSTDRLPPIPLLAPLNLSQMEALLKKCCVYYIPPDTFILKEGESGDALFIVLGGSVNVLKGDMMTSVAHLGVGACFGEMALFGPRSRRASVVAIEPTVVMQITLETAAELQEQFPEIKDNLKRYLRQRLLNNLLVTCSLFSPFPQTQREAIKQHFIQREFNRDETIFAHDEPVNELFLIVDGTAEMYLDLPSGERELIRTMGIGEIFGEEPLLTDKPSKVTVRVKDPLSALCLPKDRFKSLIMAHPRIVSTVSELLGTIPPPPNVEY